MGMGILPLQFAAGESAESLGLTGEEVFEVAGVREGVAAKRVTVRATAADRRVTDFGATVRIDTPQEAEYYRHGGILEYVLRQLAGLAG